MRIIAAANYIISELTDLLCKLAIKPESQIEIYMRRVLVALISIAAALNLAFSFRSLFPPYVFMKDFVQEYVLSRAILSGKMPYGSISELAQEYIGTIPVGTLTHPSPHPPAAAILSIPFGLFEYQTSAAVWFAIEILLIGISLHLLFGLLRVQSTPLRLVLGTLCVFVWNPYWEELVDGQLTPILLLGLLLAFLNLQSNHSIRGGILLGVVISLKFLGWPIVLFLVLRKNWRAVIAAVSALLITNAIAAMIIGYQAVFYYYARVGILVSSMYHSHINNLSLFSVGWRLFDGTGSGFDGTPMAPPIFASHSLAIAVSVLLPLFILATGLTLAYRTSDFTIAFSIMLCISILINPVAWIYYIILLTIPLFVIGDRFINNCIPRYMTGSFAVCCLLLLIPRHQCLDLAVKLGTRVVEGGIPIVNPLILFSLTMMPTFMVLTLVGLLYHLDCAFKQA